MDDRTLDVRHSAFDVCVIGGGPAGLASAIAFAMAGRKVIVLDHARPPIDKACGEGMMPDSIALLQKLGIAVPPQMGFPFRGIRFHDRNCSATAEFPAGIGVGLRRTVLHSLLRERAEALGITLRWGTRVSSVEQNRVVVGEQIVQADWIVGADGQNSAVRRSAILHRRTRETQRYGFRRHYRIAPWSSYVELYWGDRYQIYITPVAADEVGVAVLSRDPRLRVDEALIPFPELSNRLRNVGHASKEMGSLSVSRSLHRVCRSPFALVGDASGSVDAITGEGLGLSFRQGLALAAAVCSGRPEEYNKQHRMAARRLRAMSTLLLLLDKHPHLQRRVLAGLAGHPKIFSSLLAWHVGEGKWQELTGLESLQFCRTFLAG